MGVNCAHAMLLSSWFESARDAGWLRLAADESREADDGVGITRHQISPLRKAQDGHRRHDWGVLI